MYILLVTEYGSPTHAYGPFKTAKAAEFWSEGIIFHGGHKHAVVELCEVDPYESEREGPDVYSPEEHEHEQP